MAIYIKGVDNIEVEQTIAVTKLIDGTFLYTEVSDKGRMTIYTKDVYIIPEPHGRLIDADVIGRRRIDYIADGYADSPDDMMEWYKAIMETPTVIEGSE